MGMIIDLSGKSVLITGASSGIGAQTARTFHAAGAEVLINHPGLDDTNAAADQLVTELGERAAAFAADIADAEAAQWMMSEIASSCGGIDYLINNAAIIRDRTIAKMSLEEWRQVIDVNLSGVFHCCKYGLEIMRDGGAVVSLGSISALQGFYGQSNYAASKAGVLSLTRVLSREAARRGIRANAIAPGVVDTSMAATIPEEVRDEMIKNVPLGRFGEPREIAEVALFLCSPMASYITGQTLEVNGGWRG